MIQALIHFFDEDKNFPAGGYIRVDDKCRERWIARSQATAEQIQLHDTRDERRLENAERLVEVYANMPTPPSVPLKEQLLTVSGKVRHAILKLIDPLYKKR